MAFDTENYLQLPKQTSLTLSPHNSTTVVFKLIGSKKLSITDLTLELRMGYEIIQKKQISVMVKDSIPPIFTTIKKSHACSETIMNNVNCSLGTWFTEVIVTCSQPCVCLNVPSSLAVLTHDELNKTGVITANISGSC